MVLAFGIVLFAQAQTSQLRSDSVPAARCSVPADDRAIRAIPGRWKAAGNAGQASEVSALYSDDAYYLTQHFVTGIIHGRVDIQAYVQRAALTPNIASTRSTCSPPNVLATSPTPSPAITQVTPAETTSELTSWYFARSKVAG